ncbi:group II intron maturase-specific domain-containing protein [Frankia sp. AgB32]|uniref:group II intron maturase-specific domain-containing protein n=1 Tax=Frankia sp. AgB32 TaxID=631119 RepID=UPI00200C21C3|nr:group II intron maturase-specific domain-containing protein [Frankia sp. AgB32]MCK9898046.1 reverse transcriptase [Frankia sp. AgB32]
MTIPMATVQGVPRWMRLRYADSGVSRGTERQARQVWEAVERRFVQIGLQLHPDKTRIVYCKDSRRRQEFEQVTFTFCGYAFRPRMAFDRKRKQVYTGFLPAVAPEKLAEMSRRIASWRIHRRTNQTLAEIARWLNPVLRGWLNYFTAFYPTMVIPLYERIDRHLMRWARWKYR